MSERRYVVELTKPVPASRLPSASQEIARRLGLEVSRVVTLLKDRVGPVTKPVLAAKADAIAAVFQEAGVDVAIYDAAAYQTEWGAPTPTPVTQPLAGEPPATTAVEQRHLVAEEPTEADRDEPDEDEEEEGEPTEPEQPYGPVTPLPELDRWDVDDPWGGLDPWREVGVDPRDLGGEVTEVGAGSEGAAEDLGGAAARRGRRADKRSEGDDLPVAVRQTAEQLPLPPLEGEVEVRPGVWVAEGDRRPLRAFLVVALVVAVVLFVALQALYAGRSGASYEDGLEAYRSGDFATARRVWERAAEAGSPRAEYMLGYLAQHGLGRPWSYREAAARYRAAADAGLPEAQLALGELYIEGLGVPVDEAEGAVWVERSAQGGHAPALYRLGELRFHGVGVPQDFDAALEAFAAAAESGSSLASDFMALAAHLRGGNVSAP